jgi:hypothetical protein
MKSLRNLGSLRLSTRLLSSPQSIFSKNFQGNLFKKSFSTYNPLNVRNVAIIAHVDHGKTHLFLAFPHH